MKAIVNVNKESQYAKLNGRTFPVKELLNSTICLNINGVSTDFSFKEVFIVDIEDEFLWVYSASQWAEKNAALQDTSSFTTASKKTLERLKKFIEANGITIEIK